MGTKYQGKTKQNHDAAELMAFVGVVGAGASMIAYFIFILLLASCQAPEKAEPLRTPSVVRSFAVQV